MGGIRNAYKFFFRKPKGKKPFRRLRHRWEDNIRMDLREIGCEGVDRSIWPRTGSSCRLL
jgi:hypothetical protein